MLVTNDDIARSCPAWTPEDIFKRIGIESRYWASPNEDTLSLAYRAAQDLLVRNDVSPSALTAVIAATGTPPTVTPSLACLVLAKLAQNLPTPPLIPAWDINAACSGYLYGLQAAYDHLLHNPDGMVLLVTSEVLSRRTDPGDEATAPIFGDAATATLVVGGNHQQLTRFEVERPVLATKAEDGESLSVPLDTPGAYIHMNGPRVFQEAVSHMVLLLDEACRASGLTPQDLDLVVPHQANQRILNAVRQKARIAEERIYSNIRHYGNTSSSSIPLALEKIMGGKALGPTLKTLGLTAFGGGFTFGGCILRIPGRVG